MDIGEDDDFQELYVFSNDKTSLLQNGVAEQEQIEPNLFNKSDRSHRLKGTKILILLPLVFALAMTIAMVNDSVTENYQIGHGMVASDVKECSEVGVKLLKQGGSAVDAAIGSMLCVGVMNPESAGIGGGSFMLVVDPQKKAEVIDFRETAPDRATVDMFHGDAEKARWGILSVAVPGEIRGFELAHKRHGKLEWSKLFAPTIKLAREGFTLSPHTVKCMGRSLQKKILEQKNLAQILAPNGKFLVVKFPALADTLQIIAEKGADAFYEGAIADSIIASMKKHGGIISKDDLKTYRPHVRDAINMTYHGYNVITAPLPAGGPVLLSVLNILEGFNLTDAEQGTAETYHYIIEAFKFAYAQRTRLGDPFNETAIADLQNIVNTMLSKSAAQKLRQKIRADKTFPPSYYGPFFEQASDHGTAHLSVLGPDGDLVSLTSTINGCFGSGIMTDTGILLNNEMDDFCFPNIISLKEVSPSKANFLEPGKRPLSSCVPTVVLHSKDTGFRLSLGGVGGTHITTAVAQVLLNILSFNNPLEEAIEKTRVHHQLLPNHTEIEDDRLDKDKLQSLIQKLESFGHEVLTTHEDSVVNGVLSFHNKFEAHSDSRRGGEGTAQFRLHGKQSCNIGL